MERVTLTAEQTSSQHSLWSEEELQTAFEKLHTLAIDDYMENPLIQKVFLVDGKEVAVSLEAYLPAMAYGKRGNYVPFGNQTNLEIEFLTGGMKVKKRPVHFDVSLDPDDPDVGDLRFSLSIPGIDDIDGHFGKDPKGEPTIDGIIDQAPSSYLVLPDDPSLLSKMKLKFFRN